MATQFSAMNSRQAKIARSWMLAPDPSRNVVRDVGADEIRREDDLGGCRLCSGQRPQQLRDDE